MKYSQEFIEKVKAAFPLWKTLHDIAEQGEMNLLVGRYLSDNQPDSMSMPLVKAVLNGDYEAAKKIAERMEMKYTLYHDWQKEIDNAK